MAQTQLFIPDKINVGFQERSGTYTGKLAYVIYWDKKGVLRKEKSWNSWRDQKIDSQEFTNEPTEGFVLNKKVGGYKSDWNFRQSYVRVYDPRDFEFEITVENLLFILENCSAIKGKGLEGQFVYSWSGTDLVLLPVNCENYKACTNYTELQAQKVSKKDLVPGNIYLDKSEVQHLYLGRHTRYRMESKQENKRDYYSPHIFSYKKSNHHVFVPIGKKGLSEYFVFDRDMNSLVSEKSSEFAQAAQNWYESIEGSEPVELVSKPAEFEVTQDNFYGKGYPNIWVKSGDKFLCSRLEDASERSYDYKKNEYVRISTGIYSRLIYTVSLSDKLECIESEYKKNRYDYGRDLIKYSTKHDTTQFFQENIPLDVEVKLKSGKTYPIKKYLHIY